MPIAVKYMEQKIIDNWKKKGLKISFPMRENKQYFKSDDGIFVESADKYLIKFSAGENRKYTENPAQFRDDFLKNVKFFFDFHQFIYKQLEKTEDLTSVLVLTYLFLSAMDNHYYHFDRYLVYENYPETPVGFWWKKLKDYHKNNLPETNFLLTIIKNKEIIKQYKKKLSKSDFKDFNLVLKNIGIFQDIQQKEAEIVTGYPAKDDLLIKTGFGLWQKLCELIKKNKHLVNDEIIKLLDEHPIWATRQILLEPQLKCFDKTIVNSFRDQINLWLD